MEKGVPERYQNQPGFLDVSREEAARLHSEGDFNLTVKEMKRIFDASDSWVGKYWIPFVSHVYYPCDNAILWFSYDSFIKRYEENAIASFQQSPKLQTGMSPDMEKKDIGAGIDKAGPNTLGKNRTAARQKRELYCWM